MVGAGASFGFAISFGSHLQEQVKTPQLQLGISPKSMQVALQVQNGEEQLQDRWTSSILLFTAMPSAPKMTIKIEIIVFIK
jgi:hypothetical protein